MEFLRGPMVLRGGMVMPSAVAMDDDAGALVKKAEHVGASALFLETFLSHLGDREAKRRIETNNEFSVRRAIEPVLAACRAANLIGWGLMHPRKTVEGSFEDSISGSAAFRNFARHVLQVFKDPQDNSEVPGRLLASSKANYEARRPKTLRFRIDPWERNPAIGRVVWGIAEQGKLYDPRRIEDIWHELQEKRKGQRPRRDVRVQQAEKFLLCLLANGNMLPPKTIKEAAEGEGIPWRNIETAKANLSVESAYETGVFPTRVIGWRLPTKPDPEGEM